MIETVREISDGGLIAGKYRIQRLLGKGGMGVVVEAIHIDLDDRVAIKFLTPGSVTEPEAMSRFVREAKAVVRLRSEHIARVRDVGTLPSGDPYIVMEFLDGVELRDMMRPRLAPSALVDLLIQACEGLAEAHAIGIVHRDLKPSNLFVTKHADGTPLLKVLDFGVSKLPVDGERHLTGTSSWMGTPSYMSPEQMRSSKFVNPRSDIWSLGVVLYEGLEGRLPFPGESLADLCISVTMSPPEPLTDRTPRGLDAVVMRCLAKTQDDRYADVGALAEALAPFAESPGEAAGIVLRTKRLLAGKRATTAPVPEPSASTSPMPAVEPSPMPVVDSSPSAMYEDLVDELVPRRRSHRWMLAAIAFASLVATFVIVVIATRSASEQPREEIVESPKAPVEQPGVVHAPVAIEQPAADAAILDAESIVEPAVADDAAVPQVHRRKSKPVSIDARPAIPTNVTPDAADPFGRRI